MNDASNDLKELQKRYRYPFHYDNVMAGMLTLFVVQVSSFFLNSGIVALGTLSKKKNDIIWEFFPNVGPPPPPPPFWEPFIQKKF